MLPDEWNRVDENADTLVNSIGTIEAYRLAVYASYNSSHARKCLDNLRRFKASRRERPLPEDFRRIQIASRIRVGEHTEALLEAQNLARDNPCSENWIKLLELRFQFGDIQGVSLAAKQALRYAPDSSVQDLLTVATMLLTSNFERARDFWKAAAAKKPEGETPTQLVDLGYKLGLDSELNPHLSNFIRNPDLAKPMSPEEVRKTLERQRESAELANEIYKTGQVPIHAFAHAVNLTLGHMMYALWDESSRTSSPMTSFPQFAFYSSRSSVQISPSELQETTLHPDLTAILLAFKLDALEAIEGSVAEISISASMIPELQEMRIHLQDAQQTMIDSSRALLELVGAESIRKYEFRLDTEQPIEDVIEQAFAELKIDQQEKITIVGFPKDPSSETSTKSTKEAPQSILQIETGHIPQVLLELGIISNSECEEAQKSLRVPTGSVPLESIPEKGSIILFRPGTARLVATSSALARLGENFDVWVSSTHIGQAGDLLKQHETASLTDAWLAKLITHLNEGLNSGVYTLLSEEHLRTIDDTGSDDNDGSLFDLVRLKARPHALAWCDDRMINGHQTAGQVPIVTSLDLLQALNQTAAIPNEHYFMQPA